MTSARQYVQDMRGSLLTWLAVTVTACIRPTLYQASQSLSLGGEGGREAPLLAEELQAPEGS